MNVLEKIEKYGLIPTTKLPLSGEQAVSVAAALKKGGLDILELSCLNEGVEEAVRAVKARFADMIVGVGEIASAGQARAAAQAGADFVTSSALSQPTAACCQELGLCLIPGCATPADVEQPLLWASPP